MKIKNKKALASVLLASAVTLSGCGAVSTKVDLGKDDVYFSTVATRSFEGLGVEWGVYEDTNKLGAGAWDKIISSVDRLSPNLVRCMLNFDWVVTNFDNKGTSDLNDDTWDYDFNNKFMKNACEILEYCQVHGIKVALGVWNVIGSVGEDDIYGMIPNATADIRWAKMSADLMEYLLKVKGYTCIKWYVSTNEPNEVGNIGSSKNAYNTYSKWEKGIKNVRAAFDRIGLKDLDIVGGDVTRMTGIKEYLPNIAKNLSSTVHNYGVHLYVSNYIIDNGDYQKEVATQYNALKKLDSSLGVNKPLMIWEAGLLDGKNNVTDCNSYIGNFSYGIRMADYTIQSILAGVNGIVYWDLDDAMHFMYTENGSTPKEWGMFSSLTSASAVKQEYRPWYHSSVLLTNLLKSGNTVLRPTVKEESNSFRSIATVSADGTSGGFVAVNRGITPITKTFCLGEQIKSDSGKLYIYIFNEKNLHLGSDGFVVPNMVIDGSLNNRTTITLPAGSVAVCSSEML